MGAGQGNPNTKTPKNQDSLKLNLVQNNETKEVAVVDESDIKFLY